MKNRSLRIHFLFSLASLLLLVFFLPRAGAQNPPCGTFSFGPTERFRDTIYVGATCKVPLAIDNGINNMGYPLPSQPGGFDGGRYCVVETGGKRDTFIMKSPSVGCFTVELRVMSITGSNGKTYNVTDTIPAGVTVTIAFRGKSNLGILSPIFNVDRVYVDTIKPVFTVLPPANITVECGLPAPATVKATDNCDSLKLTVSDVGDWSLCQGGQVKRTWTAVDKAGNSVAFSQNIHIVPDTLAPTITGFPISQRISCEGADYQFWLDLQRSFFKAEDNCGYVKISDNAPPTFPGKCGEVSVTFTARDSCGRSSTVTVSYTVYDSLKPVITTPAIDTVRICDAGDPLQDLSNWLDNYGYAQATDNCGAVSWTYFPRNPNVGGCTGRQGDVVTFVVRDLCGNTDTTRASFTIRDINPPSITIGARNRITDCDGQGNQAAFNDWLNTRAGSIASDVCTPSPNLRLSYQVNGNTVDAAGVRAALDASIAQGCKDSIVIGGITYNNVVGMVRVMFAYEDNCGNVSTTDATFAIIDTFAPVFSRPAASLTLECDTVSNIAASFLNWYNSQGGALVTDACSSVSFRSVPDLPTAQAMLAASQAASCGNTGQVTVSFFASDACGNETPVPSSATFRIVDNIAPRINPTSSDISVECDNNAGANQAALQNWIANHGGASASDGCGLVSWSGYKWRDIDGNSGNQITPPVVPASNCRWWVDVIFEAQDECGNQSTTRSRFNIKDITKPILSGVPANVTVQCDAVPPAPVNITATDNCDTQVDIAFNERRDNGACADRYQIVRTWTATDDCGNRQVATQTVTVIDNVVPVLSGIPADTLVNCGQIPAPATPSATDNCDPSVDISLDETSTQSPDVNSCAHYNYTITRIWTATDNCGNTTRGVQLITVRDVEAPVFTRPANVTIECDQPKDPQVTGVVVGASDNCAPFTITHTDNRVDGSCANNYTLERTWLATDVCGNTSTDIQTITVLDRTAPQILSPARDSSIDCTTDAQAEAAFQLWIAQTGRATFRDNCGLGLIFAAVPGTYNPAAIDLTNPATFPQSVGGLNPASCPSPIQGVYRQERVDFVIVDQCNNVSVTTATFTVTDNTPPVFERCAADMTLNNQPGTCEALVTLPAPVIMDACANGSTTYLDSIIRGVALLTNSEEIPVSDIQFSFSVPAPPIVAVSGATLTIELINVDGEEPTEYFDIIGENNTPLGKTTLTNVQCGFSSTQISLTKAQLDAWALDGVIQIQLKPNIPANLPGRYAINPICPNALVKAVLGYQTSSTTGISYQYSINNGPRISVSPIGPATVILPVGGHFVTYYATDCAGNVASCNFQVNILDKEPPVATCPQPIIRNTIPDSCALNVQLPLPFASDNCGLPSYNQTQPANPNDALMTFTYNPNLLEFLADNKSFTFSGTSANASGNVRLTLFVRGDVESAGEYFTILAEDNSVLGTTEVGQPNVVPGDCNAPSAVSFDIPAAVFNQWAADGSVTFRAVSNVLFSVPPSIPGRGINPCDPAKVKQSGDNDGTSSIVASLSYTALNVSYYMTGATTAPLTAFPKPSTNPTVRFNSGTTNVFYLLPDVAGNVDTCSFTVNVVDVQPPVAKCNTNIFIFVNATGLPDTLRVPQINAGSTDNCGIVSYALSPNVFNCNQSGTVQAVTMTVRDAAGLTSQCVALINIQSASPSPTYELGLCGSDTLKLFANPPGGLGNSFKYKWYSPTGTLISTQQNPVLPNVSVANSGVYRVEIEGFSGCKADGTVSVFINPQSKTPEIKVKSGSCDNQPVELTTQPYFGARVTYSWYRGTPSTGTLLGTSSGPSFTIPNPGLGVSSYYVIIQVDNCVSNPSLPVVVNIGKAPVASIIRGRTTLCEGELIALGTNATGSNLNYQWTGPDGFTSSLQYPPSFTGTPAKTGIYTLVVTDRNTGCPSIADSLLITVTARPAKPQVSFNGLVCTGDSIVLTASAGGDVYYWISPRFDTIPTLTNRLVILNAQASSSGVWRVYSSRNGCRSEDSNPINIIVENKPPASFTYQPNPACSNSTISLKANNIPGITYIWTAPAGAPPIPPVYNPDVPPVSGRYSLTVVTSTGCSNLFSTDITVREAPRITATSDNAQPCSTGNQDVKITPTVSPFGTGNYQFEWKNQNGQTFSFDSILTIPNATFNDRGNYTLVVTDRNSGCKSLPKTHVLDLTFKPARPDLKPQRNALCDGELLQIDVTNQYPGRSITYRWITPLGVRTSTIPTLQIGSATVNSSGNYAVVVDVDGCISDTSNVTFIKVSPIPAKPLIVANTPVCEGDSLKLCLQSPVSGARYEWSSNTVAGFNSTLPCPVIYPVTKNYAGLYKLRIIVDGCGSPYSDELQVDVKSAPAAPEVSAAPNPICISNPGASLVLTIKAPGIPGARYIWYNAQNDTVVGGPTAALNFTLTNLSGFRDGIHDFYARSVVGGCLSVPALVSVTMNTIPNEQAFAGNDIYICSDKSSTELKAKIPGIGTGTWTQVGGTPVTIVSPGSPTTPVNGLEAGKTYTFRWTLSNGACGAYSSDEVKVVVDVTAQASADSLNVCNVTTVNLKAKPAPSGSVGTWTQSPAQAGLGIVIDNPNDPLSKVTGLKPGNSYVFRWTLSNQGCGNYSSVDVLVTVAALPAEKAFAGADFTACGDGSVTLSADPAVIGIGTWRALSPDARVTSPNNPKTTVTGLDEGIYKFIWTLSNNACGAYSSDTVSLTYHYIGKAKDDLFAVPFAGTVKLDIISNDDLPKNWKIKITKEPDQGVLSPNGDGTFNFMANIRFAGEDRFTYEICPDECPNVCSPAVVTLRIGDGAECLPPTIITPNNDGVNDVFVIPCLATGKYPKNSVIIFNQWGDEVFRAAPYNNDWSGTYDGEDLPAGTYFVVVTFGPGEQPVKGFLMIER